VQSDVGRPELIVFVEVVLVINLGVFLLRVLEFDGVNLLSEVIIKALDIFEFGDQNPHPFLLVSDFHLQVLMLIAFGLKIIEFFLQSQLVLGLISFQRLAFLVFYLQNLLKTFDFVGYERDFLLILLKLIALVTIFVKLLT